MITLPFSLPQLERRQQDSNLFRYLSPVLAIALTLLSGALIFLWQGQDPVEGLYTFFILPINDSYGLAELCIKAAPMLLCATGLALCFRANIWNIGAEGQLLMGALFGSWAALQVMDNEGTWPLAVALFSGSVAGLLWAGIPAVLRNHFNTNEILTTIMLNYVALNLLLWAVHGPLKDPDGFNFPESALFEASVTLPVILEGTRLHIGALFALLAVSVVWVLLSRTFIGFQLKVIGMDASAGRFAGYKEKALVYFALLTCGTLAGLAGASEVTGPIGQLVPSVSPGYGYAAIIVAFLGRLHPVGIVLASLLMALVYMGGEMGQINLGLPLALGSLFQGMLLFYLLMSDVLISYRLVWKKRPQTNTQHSAVQEGV
ncbi:ABC transporter permease [Parendozoicomonas haliclonae]|uniref:Branched-chain amino acid transport system / permease component n=1 Tax=Parendozoicomonas haliclonae TaxID=1960125 RepID=A0A1X7AKP7_9GAMM|nr:ABC transporter permease [Parendozoicomonas haliclonae]SMA47574.1 Branched-chain amino acid transport system / permease component [Parendozoicomonas haliclonae]